MSAPTSSPYEAWVSTVRAWSTDEKVTLVGLPQLTAESMPASSYRRLAEHLTRAMETVTKTWSTTLNSLLSSLPDPHEFGRELVGLRRGLARRLELARHPGLPPELTSPMSEAAERDIIEYQKDIEEAVNKLRRTTPAPVVDKYLLTLRQNSFLAVLGYDSTTDGGRMSARTPTTPLATVDQPASGVPQPGRPTRRIVIA